MPSTIPDDMADALSRFNSRCDEIVEAFCRRLDAAKPPSPIYHYTNDIGLRGILESGRLWFTDIFDLNDPSELRHSYEQAAKSLHRWAEKVSSEKPEARVFARHFAEFGDVALKGAAHLFVCSFSARGDDLGQWRAYADNGRGYALEFDTRLLESAFTKKDGKPVENHSTFCVSYDQELLARVQDQLLAAGVFDLVSMPSGRNLHGDALAEYMKELQITLTLHMLQVSLFFKHRAYDNEAEYRFMQHFGAAGDPPLDVKRRFRPHQLAWTLSPRSRNQQDMQPTGNYCINVHMHELRTWLWEYTNAAGDRVVSRWRMTEHEALHYRDPVRLHHTLRVTYDDAAVAAGTSRGQRPTAGLPPNISRA